MTKSTVHRSSGLSSIGRLRELRQYQDVLWQLVQQFLTLRYRRTLLGYLWTLANPLLTLLVTAVVFSTLFRLPLASYTLFLFAGLLPWNFFSMSVTQSCTAFIQNEGLLRKIYIPKAIFPLSVILGTLIDSILSMGALAVLMLPFGMELTPALLFLPVGYSLLFAFALGLGMLLSIATLFFRDLQYVLNVLMQAWFFLTPVMYRGDSLNGNVAWLVALNPMTSFVELFRAPLLHGRVPPMNTLAACTLMAASALAVGVLVLLANEKKIIFRL